MAALGDTGASSAVIPFVKAVGAIRTFEESGAMQVPFGRAERMPLAVARRLGIVPSVAILEKVGGQSPLALLADLGGRIAGGEVPAALMFGSEAISTVPRAWPGCEHASVQSLLDAVPKAALAPVAKGRGRIGTYTVTFSKGVPEQVIVIGELECGGRFVATSREAEVITTALADDPLGRNVDVTPGDKRNTFTFA